MTTEHDPRTHLTVSLPPELWRQCRERWPNKKASHIVAMALRIMLQAYPPGQGR